MKKATAMERLLREGFFETKEAALPYLMSGAVYCGGVKVQRRAEGGHGSAHERAGPERTLRGQGRL